MKGRQLVEQDSHADQERRRSPIAPLEVLDIDPIDRTHTERDGTLSALRISDGDDSGAHIDNRAIVSVPIDVRDPHLAPHCELWIPGFVPAVILTADDGSKRPVSAASDRDEHDAPEHACDHELETGPHQIVLPDFRSMGFSVAQPSGLSSKPEEKPAAGRLASEERQITQESPWIDTVLRKVPAGKHRAFLERNIRYPTGPVLPNSSHYHEESTLSTREPDICLQAPPVVR